MPKDHDVPKPPATSDSTDGFERRLNVVGPALGIIAAVAIFLLVWNEIVSRWLALPFGGLALLLFMAPQHPNEIRAAIGIFRRLGATGVLALVWSALPLVALVLIGVFGASIAEWLRGLDARGPYVFAGIFALASGLLGAPTWVQATLGGYAFGMLAGSLGAVAGYTGAALIGYAVAAAVSGDRARTLIREHATWQAVYDELLSSGAARSLGLVTLIRLSPSSPFAATNLILAATRVPLLIYGVATVIGLLPRTLMAVYIGSQLTSFNDPSKPKWIGFAGIAVAVIAVMIIGHFGKKAIARVTARAAQTDHD